MSPRPDSRRAASGLAELGDRGGDVAAQGQEIGVHRGDHGVIGLSAAARGRAINNSEPNWPQTLKGFPREIYETWAKEFRDKGYRMTAKIVDFPGGKPGDVGIYMSWD